MFKRILVLLMVVSAAGLGTAPAAHSATKPKAYENCAALNRAFPNGVAKTQTAATAALSTPSRLPR